MNRERAQKSEIEKMEIQRSINDYRMRTANQQNLTNMQEMEEEDDIYLEDN